MKILKKEVVYIGAPLFLTRSPTKDFKFLLDKLETKLMGGEASAFLGQVGVLSLAP